MNVIGRDDGHAPPARAARDDSLQVEGLLEMDDVRPGERTLYLAAPRPREGVALRGNERRNKRDTKVRKRIIRHTNTTIITMTRRSRQHANIVPPLSQQ